MKLILLSLLLTIVAVPAQAESINLASQQYVKDNCVTKSGTWQEQTLTGNYSVDGSLSVPTPPLPPEE